MNLDRVAAVIRPRAHWEAVDLGFTMVRAWWRPVWGLWLLTVLPLWIILAASLGDATGWLVFVLWWLKPLYERLPLHVFSRALFVATPRMTDALLAAPRLIGRGFLASLFWRRLSLSRSYDQPVAQLENLKGSTRRGRLRTLHRQGFIHAILLTIVCWLMEAVFFFALLSLVELLIPAALGVSVWADTADDAVPGQRWIWLTAAFVAVGLVAPFYTAGGFALYLNRRTRLEGWDIEVGFRRLSSRRARATDRARGSIAAATVLACLAHFAVTPAVAQPPGEPSGVATEEATTIAGDTDPQTAIREILAGPDFATQRTTSLWQPRSQQEERQATLRVPILEALVGTLAPVVKILIWVALGAVLVTLGVYIVRNGPAFGGRRKQRIGPPETVFGLDIRPESLPDDVVAAAWELWRAGERTAALSLLYRGALAELVRRELLAVKDSWTEGDCLRHLRRAAPGAFTDDFARLTSAWQQAAYAHQPPAASRGDELLDPWRRHLQEARA